MKKALFFALLVMMTVAGLAPAAALQEDHVRSDAKWLFHANFDAMRSSELGKLIQADIQTKYQDKIDALAQLLGSDLTKDLHGVTLYGAQGGEENASALFYGNYNQSKLLALLVLNPAYSKSDYNGVTIHHWVEEKKQKEQYGTFAADDLIVMAQTQDAVIAALDVLSNKTPSLDQQTGATLFSLVQGQDNAIALAAAEGLSELAGENEQAAVLKNSRLFMALAAEEAGSMKLDVHLEAQNDESAMQIEQIVRGMLAFASLQSQQNPQVSKLLQAVMLTRTNNALDCHFSYPSASLYEMIQSHADLAIEKSPF
jgi:hypothetical protein